MKQYKKKKKVEIQFYRMIQKNLFTRKPLLFIKKNNLLIKLQKLFQIKKMYSLISFGLLKKERDLFLQKVTQSRG